MYNLGTNTIFIGFDYLPQGSSRFQKQDVFYGIKSISSIEVSHCGNYNTDTDS